VFSRADEQDVLDELLNPGDDSGHDAGLGETFYAQPGLQTKVIRKLKRGQFRIDAELDLHAMTEGTARRTLVQFLNTCQQEGSRCVRVIHGKGLRSGTEGPVIKPMVERELGRRKQVLAFCSARPAHGGSGAVYVLLRRA
jgi:DNA-nicking Smr family endonuclease